MNHEYIVTLPAEELETLRALIEKGQTQGYRIKHAQILLGLDEIPENQEWSSHTATVVAKCLKAFDVQDCGSTT